MMQPALRLCLLSNLKLKLYLHSWKQRERQVKWLILHEKRGVVYGTAYYTLIPFRIGLYTCSYWDVEKEGWFFCWLLALAAYSFWLSLHPFLSTCIPPMEDPSRLAASLYLSPFSHVRTYTFGNGIPLPRIVFPEKKNIIIPLVY